MSLARHPSGRQPEDTMSRATSLSRKSGLSRNTTLIKRSIAPQDLRPSDILIERFVAWKAIVKQLIAYFEGLADIENNTARELTKLGAVIQVPFRAGNQFLGEGGMQDIFYGVRDKTRAIADDHANLGRTIDGSIVQHLQKLRSEIKAHLKHIREDTGKLATSVARERELSTRSITELARCIALFKNTPMAVTSKDDPYVQNMVVTKQLQKQVHEENALAKSIIIMQQNSAHFEEGIVRSIQSAWTTFDEWQSRTTASVQETWRIMSTNMAALAPDREWISFAARTDHLLDPETPLRNPDTVEYPSKNDPSIIAVHVGVLERKKRWTRTYRAAFYALTPAGYLHEYASSDPHQSLIPVFSLFLPLCTLGPPSNPATSKSHKFHIEGKRDATGSRSTSILGTNSQTAYAFRARSHEEMMEWWNDIRMLVARYLIASEQIDRSGPVAAAVRAAGYLSEEEEESEEGSSVEEEEDLESHPANYRNSMGQDTAVNDETPAYVKPVDNGFTPDKKPNTLPGAFDPEPIAGDGANLSRRPSKRQQEKAPEGQEPRVIATDFAGQDEHPTGKANGESRFKEGL